MLDNEICAGCGSELEYKDIWSTDTTPYEPHDCNGQMTCYTCNKPGCTDHPEE